MVIVTEYSERGSIIQIFPKFFSDCPLQCQKFQFTCVDGNFVLRQSVFSIHRLLHRVSPLDVGTKWPQAPDLRHRYVKQKAGRSPGTLILVAQTKSISHSLLAAQALLDAHRPTQSVCVRHPFAFHFHLSCVPVCPVVLSFVNVRCSFNRL